MPQIIEPPRQSSVPTPARAATPTTLSSANPQANASRQPTPPSVPVRVSASAASLSRSLASSGTSPAGSVPHVVQGKFKDLDKFLDSESETEEEEEEEEDDDTDDSDVAPAPRAVTAPPRSAIVPEYDETSSEEEDGETESEDEDGLDRDERAALYGQYR